MKSGSKALPRMFLWVLHNCAFGIWCHSGTTVPVFRAEQGIGGKRNSLSESANDVLTGYKAWISLTIWPYRRVNAICGFTCCTVGKEWNTGRTSPSYIGSTHC